MNQFANEQSDREIQHRMSRRTAIGRAAGAGAALAGAAYLSRSAVSASQLGASMTQDTASPPTVVLVHGAFADGSSWNNVIERLQADGIAVIAPANPLRGIATDAAYLDLVVATIPGPVLLVGHSYGGAVITSISPKATNVVGLVYVAAFALDEGETGFDILEQFPATLLGPALRPATADPDHPDVLIDPALFHEAFAADLPAAGIPLMAATQRPSASTSFAEKSGPPAWKRLPTWYAVATADNAVGTEAERFMAERMGAVTVEIDASHVVMISRPDAIADLITTALAAVS